VGNDDAILSSDPLFAVLIAAGIMGLLACLFLSRAFLNKRHTRAIITSDWRFTGAFLLACALLNTATLTFLGPNTNSLCLLRMWVFHFFYALVFSPLFVKTYRMMKLVGNTSIRRVTITHRQTAIYCIPIVAAQLVILIVFSIVDPSKQMELVMNSGPDVTQRIICSHDTSAFLITELIFEGGLLLLGCILAFKTRNMKGDFGEAKQLIIAMYGIAVVGSVVVIVSNAMGEAQGQANKRFLYAVGIFWGTVFSCCAFVLPRLFQAQEEARQTNRQHVRVTGLQTTELQTTEVQSGAD